MTVTDSHAAVRRLVYSAVFLALALALPFLTGQIPQVGGALLPMHLPVLLCGFVCGWPWGLAVGLVAPLLRSLLFGMPPMFPTAAAMALELAAYGAFAGLLSARLPRSLGGIYGSLLGAMTLGRVVWGCAMAAFLGMQGASFGLTAFWAGAVVNALPGIACQLVLIPILAAALDRAGLSCRD